MEFPYDIGEAYLGLSLRVNTQLAMEIPTHPCLQQHSSQHPGHASCFAAHQQTNG
jgi:hypothetical protein